ncbi:hypothetical protein BT63DRAFT_477851 [Microthyrium microscopicum]|uniref:Large ribosomal subunit protein mL59 domain-containing protein n=1 Tax=Microthyrium microscopicum TaxID=703497 RepID=A0A6A6UHS3_9PEZI|nr:hypothetical protein BT63DRAFT_477851 [Microthyrium microscopicum]
MAAAANTQFIEIAKTLPPRLIRFFTRFPPKPETAAEPVLAPRKVPILKEDGTTKYTIEPNNRHVTSEHPTEDPNYNPFLPWQNPTTQKWRAPMYNMRKQAGLVRLARAHGVEELLPWTIKKQAVREARRELGSRVRGTGEGQQVKGHSWERAMMFKVRQRETAMTEMPKLIREWKTRGHGVGWKKYPR